ncbi:PepSY-associated membrane protein [Methylobacterium sp. 4-46]|uniref:PepSY-associated TM helix domain-containing protein n=1 Tax=unclassified Methylobacterium TaxID=2615210 RepID=UPI000152D89F|nr:MULTISPECIES: PepSY-associated TM helix domain-containing protein [Methylobacterium]ACA15951.1 PepSY-associated membrane protein [Methylobacterium sp. 4-46]WFT81668.1 PepSY-associated TM helix domain-containing protein [Methylobacterium nodulans]
MNAARLRAWRRVHTWTSLIATLFLLLLCLTGLPLIFHREIDGWFGAGPAPLASGQAPLSLDRVAQIALADHPGQVLQYLGHDEDAPRAVFAILNKAADAHPNASVTTLYDAATGARLGPPRSAFMQVMLRLHVDLYAGLPGKLFLGAMGALLVAAIVSGVVLYGPLMRRMAFGTIRAGRARRILWLDLHNLMGIVTVAWLTTVGATGVINTLSEPMIGRWKATDLAAMHAGRGGAPATPRLSLDAVVARAVAAAPGMTPSFIAFPGTAFSTGRHFGVFLRGDTVLTSRLLRPVLLDAETGAVAATRRLPWYLTALLVSQPLHFGDYGGLPLKLIWALLDLVSVAVLGSGLALWLAKRRAGGAAPPPAPVPARSGRA